MTSFVITVPGTFGVDITDSTRSALESALASQHTDVSESEGLDLLPSTKTAPSPSGWKSKPRIGMRQN